jgi:hypothetical protein
MRKGRVKIDGRVVGGEMLLGKVEKERMRLLIRWHARFCGFENVGEPLSLRYLLSHEQFRASPAVVQFFSMNYSG